MVKAIAALILPTIILSTTAKETNTNMRAGLWQITTSSDLLLLAQHIPQEQLKGIEQMAKEYGLEMPQLENGAAISKTCITQKMAAQQTLPQFYQEDLGCVTNNATRHGDIYKTSFSCNSPQLKGKGSAEGKITSSVTFAGTSHFKGVAQGATVNERAEIKGRWISASCGDTQPL